ncbi:MAG: nicotinamide riboside transporter PnuC [Aquabacterium sp.]|uniref:nicotinamide riboside transporter PnuC n=1 Tax=Aquabacterium sp. TaxID=1872578 RepID=UPI001205ABFD|nr:nicotinamide riboside transporter PnuC [Aquabacterium sp.]TAK93928.1 MAG: nicotinamide riboside transporter PnuC [Aquabacterium sp.]
MLPGLDGLATSLAWVDPWLAPLFTAWGVPVSQLECWAFILSLLMVGLNLKVNAWGWPLAIISSILYGLLFARSKLYGEASLQLLFVVMSVWGWWQWLAGKGADDQALRVRALSIRARWMAAGVTLLMWPALGALLTHVTDSDVPYLDALPTAGSVMGQWLLARKFVDNWPCWLLVNLISMGLFAYKQLWLTVLLYGLFAVLSVLGWRVWLRKACSLTVSLDRA